MPEPGPTPPPYFREVQRFRQPWLWLVIAPGAGFVWYLAMLQLVLGRPMGGRPAPDIVLVIAWLLVGVGIPLFLAGTSLVVEARSDALYIRFFPLMLRFRRIPWSDVESFQARRYRPIREYGGWGIRFSWWSGWAYNVSGDRGVQLMQRGGKRLLIGSQRAEELAEAIRRAMDAARPIRSLPT